MSTTACSQNIWEHSEHGLSQRLTYVAGPVGHGSFWRIFINSMGRLNDVLDACLPLQPFDHRCISSKPMKFTCILQLSAIREDLRINLPTLVLGPEVASASD